MFKCRFFKKNNNLGKSVRATELAVILKEFEDIQVENVTRLIRYSSGKFIVFLDAEGEVDWETTDDFDKNWGTAAIDATSNRVEEIEHSPEVPYLSKKFRCTLNQMLGGALAAELNGSSEEAQTAINSALVFLNKRTSEVSRKWQLIGALIITGISYFVWRKVSPEEYIWFGCLGALFSILCKIGKVQYDCQAGPFLYFMEILSRFIAAIISAYIAKLLFQMDLLFTVLKSDENSAGVLSLICFISGFSERLVPSIVSHISSTEEKEED